MRTSIAALAAALLLAAAVDPALAGMRATYVGKPGPPGSQPDPALVIEVADNGDFRAGVPGRDDYALGIGDSVYLVAKPGGTIEVARVADLAAAFDTILPPVFKGLFGAAVAAPAGKLSIVAGEARTIGGHAGRVFSVKGLALVDAGEAVDFVLSDEPALASTGRAFARFMETTVLVAAPVLGANAAAMVSDMREVFARGAALDGGRFILQGAEASVVPAERLALPAEPKTVAFLVAQLAPIIGAAAKPGEGPRP